MNIKTRKRKAGSGKRTSIHGFSLSAICNPQSANPGGSTLTEVLMSILAMAIGLVAIASLFPAAVLRSINATRLTRGTVHRHNAEAMVDLLAGSYEKRGGPPATWVLVEGGLVHDPDVDGNVREHFRSPSFSGNYVVDPLGARHIGGNYGNAFVILKPLLAEFSDRMLNTPLAESAIIGCATGAALLGKRPVAEIQFNDFIACGFNQLVNNAAKVYYRWGQPVPMTVRLPWGGLRAAGPYHSQNTEPWFYRTAGLKIVCPATPREAKGLLKAAIRDDNPVLFLEHIALYRDPNIKQVLPTAEEDILVPIGSAHLKREGRDLTMVTYGAYVHRCLAAAQALQAEGISCQVLDLRSLMPLDKPAILDCVRSTGRVLIVHEDSKTGGIGQSLAAFITEEAFEYLDVPVVVLGALDTPVPYSPPLEEAFLVSQPQIAAAARNLVRY